MSLSIYVQKYNFIVFQKFRSINLDNKYDAIEIQCTQWSKMFPKKLKLLLRDLSLPSIFFHFILKLPLMELRIFPHLSVSLNGNTIVTLSIIPYLAKYFSKYYNTANILQILLISALLKECLNSNFEYLEIIFSNIINNNNQWLNSFYNTYSIFDFSLPLLAQLSVRTKKRFV